MNSSLPSHPLPQISSPFDLIETINIDSHSLSQLTSTISHAFNSLVQILASVIFIHFSFITLIFKDPERAQKIISDLKISNQDASRIAETHQKFSRINDMMGEFIQTYYQDQSTLTTQVLYF